MYARKAIARALFGFPIGIFIATVILFVVSFIFGEGRFLTVTPAFETHFGNELNATLAMYMLAGVLGAVFAACSVIFEVERWGLLRQTTTHGIIVTATMLLISYVADWIPHVAWGAALYIAIFVVIYAAIWASLTLYWRKRVSDANKEIGNGR
jgi:hypothetical protein